MHCLFYCPSYFSTDRSNLNLHEIFTSHILTFFLSNAKRKEGIISVQEWGFWSYAAGFWVRSSKWSIFLCVLVSTSLKWIYYYCLFYRVFKRMGRQRKAQSCLSLLCNSCRLLDIFILMVKMVIIITNQTTLGKLRLKKQVHDTLMLFNRLHLLACFSSVLRFLIGGFMLSRCLVEYFHEEKWCC